jgi:hypothetical protein
MSVATHRKMLLPLCAPPVSSTTSRGRARDRHRQRWPKKAASIVTDLDGLERRKRGGELDATTDNEIAARQQSAEELARHLTL